MAEQLIEDMSTEWKPEQYEDHFKDDLMALVHRKVEHGEIERVEPPAEEHAGEVIDLTALLKRSLDVKHKATEADKHGARTAPAKAAARRKRA